jgi:nitroreductase
MEWKADPTIRTILSRRSIRRYETRPVEGEKVRLLLECACAAPSAANVRPWHFLVVDDRAKLDALADAHPYGKMLFHAPLALVVCGEPDKHEIARMYWEEDCSAAMENILLAARALGLGSVWLGVRHAPDREAGVRSVLRIPDSVAVLGIAVLGYGAEEKEPHEGIDDGAVHENGW